MRLESRGGALAGLGAGKRGESSDEKWYWYTGSFEVSWGSGIASFVQAFWDLGIATKIIGGVIATITTAKITH